MATTTPFSIPFSSPYTFGENINFRAFYTGEGLYYVKNRAIGYNAEHMKANHMSRLKGDFPVEFLKRLRAKMPLPA